MTPVQQVFSVVPIGSYSPTLFLNFGNLHFPSTQILEVSGRLNPPIHTHTGAESRAAQPLCVYIGLAGAEQVTHIQSHSNPTAVSNQAGGDEWGKESAWTRSHTTNSTWGAEMSRAGGRLATRIL